MQNSAQLFLKSGEIFSGVTCFNPSRQNKQIKQNSISFGEVVFNTGMTGYVESLTDPSYAGQILVFTYPLIGNYGVSAKSTWESKKIQVSGVVMSELAPFFSHFAAHHSLQQWLFSEDIPYIAGVDTRALTKILRIKGTLQGAIARNKVSSVVFPPAANIHWVEKVSIKEPVYYGSGDKTIIAVDCGMKENILRCLLQFPVRIKRVPYNYDYSEEECAGVFLSNGPGDPMQCQETIAILKRTIERASLRKRPLPLFGICLGIQLMALAVGARTYQLPFGHRSHNQPCLHLPTNRCYLTSQNHGYAVSENTLPAEWQVLFRNLNDQSIAGIAHQSLPYFAVQFHPEAAPGPIDTQWLFEKFYHCVAAT